MSENLLSDLVHERIGASTECGCWPWLGTISAQGYGVIGIDGAQKKAHRVVYELLIGPIPGGLPLDHLCHNADLDCFAGSKCSHRRCVNPSHLEPSTHRQNILRGHGPAGANVRKTHCVHNHEYTYENTYWWKGWRQCRTCAGLRPTSQARLQKVRRSTPT